MQTETKKIGSTTFDKVQGEIYVDIIGIKCQVKQPTFSLQETYNLMNKFVLSK